MNPYEVLGVRRDASADEIKRAYRSLAQTHHPDRTTGDVERFQAIQAAYELLSDPARRQCYDETGDIERPVDLVAQAMNELSVLLFTIFTEKTEQIERIDVVSLAKKSIRGKTVEMKKEIAKALAMIPRVERATERLSRKSGPNLLQELMRNQLKQARAQLEKAEHQYEIHQKILEVLDEYSYSVDQVDPHSTGYQLQNVLTILQQR